MPTDPVRRQRLWPALGLVVVVAWATFTDQSSPDSTGFILSAYESRTHPALDSVSPATALAGIAVLVFLTQSSNLITRAAIGFVQPRPGTAHGLDGLATARVTDTASGWDLHIGRRRLASVDRRGTAVDTTPPVGQLKGGRLIGPLERYLIVVTTLAGAYPVIAGLLAAKGIVRFPEISADRGVGSAAETFLIGSLTSWTISAAATLYLVAARAI